MPWFKKEKGPLVTLKDEEKTVRTEGLFIKCDNCRAFIWKKDLETNDKVCPKCKFHFRLGARDRLRMLFDDGPTSSTTRGSPPRTHSSSEEPKTIRERPLQRLERTGLQDAMITGEGKMGGNPVSSAPWSSRFIGGTMGAVVGEMITLAIDRCIWQNAADNRFGVPEARA